MSWDVGETRLFRWDHPSSRPRLLVLLLLGWTIEGFDERYGSLLLGRSERTSHGSDRLFRSLLPSHDVAKRAAPEAGAGKGTSAALERPCGRPGATVGEESR